MSENRDQLVEAAVHEYLRRKGYTYTEQKLREESRVKSASDFAAKISNETDTNIANSILFYNPEENQPTRYNETYTALRDWGMSSLDLYRPELLSILYPIFVHCYLDLVEQDNRTEAIKFLQTHRAEHSKKHQEEIDRLAAVTTPTHMQENDFVQNFRQYKFHVTMCRYAFELLLAYLHGKKFMLLLSIINHYLNIEVHLGQPRPRDPDTILTPISGVEGDQAKEEPFQWRLFPEQTRFYQKALDPEDVLPPREGDDEPRASKFQLPQLNTTTENHILDDLRKKVRLDANSKPNISLFTFFNTYDGMATSTVSSRGDLVAGAFQDSSIKLWDLNQEKTQGSWQQLTQHYLDTDGRSPTYKPKRKDTDSVNLIGHSGPVYGLSFSPDSQFLLSSSQDTTVRLWSLATKTNVVCYRGHTSPVWDVEFSPVGYYFATASHDKTARFWATNHSHPLRIFAGHLSDVNRVKFHPNSNYVVTGSNDKCVRLWDVFTGTCVRLFNGHFQSVYSLAVSPCGRFMASSGEDKDIILWDLATSKKITKLQGHSDTVWDLDFCVSGNVLASGGADNTVRLWDIKMVREEIYRTEQAEKREEQLRMELETEPEGEDGEGQANDIHAAQRNARRQSALLATDDLQRDKLIGSYPTKRTPIHSVHFTNTNVLCCTGPYKRPPK